MPVVTLYDLPSPLGLVVDWALWLSGSVRAFYAERAGVSFPIPALPGELHLRHGNLLEHWPDSAGVQLGCVSILGILQSLHVIASLRAQQREGAERHTGH